MTKKRKKYKKEEDEMDLREELEEISDLKKNENRALKKIFDALQKDSKIIKTTKR